MLVACTLLGPVLWYLWIYAGSANANFYFAITLAYSSAQVSLLTRYTFVYLADLGAYILVFLCVHVHTDTP